VVTLDALRAGVDASFTVTGRGLRRWPDPHPDRSPRDEEYSRVTDAAKWRIVGARADAWVTALVDEGLAKVDAGTPVAWRSPDAVAVGRSLRVVPRAVGAIPLVVARSALGGDEEAGVTLGAGDPTVRIATIPDCGCDACDSGSQDVLDELDQYVAGVVSGACRWLSSGERTIRVLADGWNASGMFQRGEVHAVIADPNGWEEVSGASWLMEPSGGRSDQPPLG
jgi:Family of unknown function (DUF6226)